MDRDAVRTENDPETPSRSLKENVHLLGLLLKYRVTAGPTMTVLSAYYGTP